MASNSFGTLFRITTWGESHGKAIGVVIDGCPAGLVLSEDDIQMELSKRAPGNSIYTSPRKEPDKAEILSGLFEGKTTGAPISIIIYNKDADSSAYDATRHLLRPGHANFSYLEKYGVFDYRGGGRSSARETACRVAAGAVAKKLLKNLGIEVVAYLEKIGEVRAAIDDNLFSLCSKRDKSAIFCPDSQAESLMLEQIATVKQEEDSIGGTVGFIAFAVPAGLGDPVYEKLEAKLGLAMMSLPASKGFEMGCGFAAAEMKGSVHNDVFVQQDNSILTRTNNAGGTLGGISTGMPLVGRVAFKPTSSIKKAQDTLDLQRQQAVFSQPETARHDPCVAIRAVPVVEAMAALVLADCVLLNRSARV